MNTESFGSLRWRELHLPSTSMSKGIQSVPIQHSKEVVEENKKALSEHPLSGLPVPTSQTEGCAHQHTHALLNPHSNHVNTFTHAHLQTHFLNTITHMSTTTVVTGSTIMVGAPGK